MAASILVTGGAGFVGSHLVDALVEQNHKVRVLDLLHTQVHGRVAEPVLIRDHVRQRRVEFVYGDIRDAAMVKRAIKDVDVVFHQAAAVGVGQSMYRIADYVSHNSLGGAVLLEAIVARKPAISKVVVASSMSIYGEGKYRCPDHGSVSPPLRETVDAAADDWEIRCRVCAATLEPLATDEDKPLHPTSVYAITKRDHEELFLTVGQAYGIPTVALRYFNIYGPRQSFAIPMPMSRERSSDWVSNRK